MLLAMLCLAVYANALSGEFVWDDHVQLVRNESIRSLENIPQMFTSSVWSFAQSTETQNNRYYRPLQAILFALVYQFSGLSPFAYHLATILLHTGATLIVYALLLELRLFGSASIVPAALFAVHPVHTEAVAWIAGTAEVACGLLYFLALWAFVRYLNGRRRMWLGVSALSFFFALLAKEMAVTFPLTAMLLVVMKRKDLSSGARQGVIALVPTLLALSLYAVLRVSATGLAVPTTITDQVEAYDWLTLGIWMFGRYIQFAFAPYPLAMFHLTALHLHDRIGSTVLYGLLIVAVLLLLWLSRAARDGLLWMGMFAATLVPVFYFKGITGGFLFSERYLYIPTLPALALLTVLGLQLPKRVAIVASVTLVAAFATGTVLQNRVWRDELALYSHATDVQPANTFGWISLAVVHINNGEYSPAQRAYEMAERTIIDRRYLQPSGNDYRLQLGLGTLAARRGEAMEAKARLQRALEIDPSGQTAYTILAGVLSNLDRNFEDAIPLLERAIELNPVDDQARDSLGVALYNLQHYDEAIGNFREALRINPQSPLARQHLETALKRISN
jgi:tetratricopeptide (TPR) repeat protein